MRALSLVVLGALMVGCGLEDGGVLDAVPVDVPDSSVLPDTSIVVDGNKQQPDTSITPDSSPLVDSSPGVDTAFPCGVDPASCNDPVAIPNGWNPVAVAPTNTACGVGFTNETHAKTAPSAQNGACDCQAQNQVAPTSCENGSVQTNYGALGCALPGLTLNVSNGGCATLNGAFDFKFSAKTLGATGGSCTGAKVVDTTKLSANDLTTCSAVTCPEKVCAGQAPQGFAACIETAGDVACPKNSPFNQKRTLGDAATLDCSACTCAASATCANPSMQFFSDNQCKNSMVTFVADGTCQDTSNFGKGTQSAIYKATVQNPTYTATGPKTPTVGLTNTKTICCR